MSALGVKGLVHTMFGVGLSIEQCAVAPVEVNVKAGAALFVGPLGPVSTVGGEGGVASTVKVRDPGVLVFPAASVAVT